MCITVLTADIGPASAGFDLPYRHLVFAPALTIAERVHAARILLRKAGQEQADDASADVVCICGEPLDITGTRYDPPPEPFAYGLSHAGRAVFRHGDTDVSVVGGDGAHGDPAAIWHRLCQLIGT